MLSRYVYIGVAVAAMLAIGGAYFKGRTDGDLIAQANARKQLVEQLTERNRIDERVKGMSSADLCRELGGVYSNGECQ